MRVVWHIAEMTYRPGRGEALPLSAGITTALMTRVRIYEELPDERYEPRKVGEFANGRLIRDDRIYPGSAATLPRSQYRPLRRSQPRRSSRPDR
jgi:hypothetical protein